MNVEDVLAVGDRLGVFFTAVVMLVIVVAFIVPILRRDKTGTPAREADDFIVPARELIAFMTEARLEIEALKKRLDRLEK